jgi:hypothetical protein
MNRFAWKVAIAATLLAPCLLTDAAHAQATRTWVSGVGNDANPCSRTAPCKTFAGAISKTFINGIINCLDPGAYGAVTITKSITIDCHEIFAGMLASGTTGVIINIGVNANDPLRTVRLRNLIIDGTGAQGSVGTRTGLKGIRIDAANAVFIDDVMIRNFTQEGILDRRTTGGALYINNTNVYDNAGAGIKVFPLTGSTRIDATIARTNSERNLEGINVGSGSRVMIYKSVMAGNTSSGLIVASPDGGSQANVTDSLITNNNVGIQRNGGGTVRLSNVDVAFNQVGSANNPSSFVDNRVSGNIGNGSSFNPLTPE